MKYFFVLFVSMFLAGCGTFGKKPEPVIEYRIKYVVIAPDAVHLQPTKKALPPARKTYQDLNEFDIKDWRVKEQLLSDAYIKQSGQVDQCNIDKKAIATFIEKAKVQYKDK